MPAHPFHVARKSAKGFALIQLSIMLAVAAVIAVSKPPGDEAANNGHASGSTHVLFGQSGGQASFVHMQPQIQDVFEIMRSLPGVAVFRNVAELDAYLAARQRAHKQGD